jgi:hypothetical protein
MLSATVVVFLVSLSAVIDALPFSTEAFENGTTVNLLHGRQTLAQVITRCTVPNTVALTFDDGPYAYLYVSLFILTLKLRWRFTTI